MVFPLPWPVTLAPAPVHTYIHTFIYLVLQVQGHTQRQVSIMLAWLVFTVAVWSAAYPQYLLGYFRKKGPVSSQF